MAMTESTPEAARARRGERLRKWWRKHVRPVWVKYEWLTVWVMGILALVLGYVGFGNHAALASQPVSQWSRFYLALQLFVLESGAVEGIVPWELDVARFLAPAVSAYTATKALALIFQEQLLNLRLRFLRRHVVICGLGRKALLLANTLHARGEKVVVIEKDAKNRFLTRCRESGALLVLGDATDIEVLRAASATHARGIIAICGDDGANAEIAVHARVLFRERPGRVLTCTAHIVDMHLWKLLREQELVLQPDEAFRLEFFNVFESGARAMLERFPAPRSGNGPPHLVVLGMGRMGENLVVRAAKDWYDAAPETRLRITVLDREARRKVASLDLHYPRLQTRCDVVPVQIDFNSMEFERGEFLAQQDAPASAFYVCLDDDSRGLSVALTLSTLMRGRKIPIVVRMVESNGLASLLEDDDTRGSFENLFAFGLLTETCTSNLVLGTTHEFLARTIHEDYLRQQADAKLLPQNNPSIQPWEKLPEHLKESNRSQAAHIGLKLKAIKCGIAPLRDWAAPLFEFTPQEFEKLAHMEHERWCAERRREGWKLARRAKDIVKRTTPYLVSWQELPEEIRDLDRNFVRKIPVILARAGFEIYRVG
jgi:hypothetical protein